MVRSWNGGWNIWVYTESAWESHIVLLYEWLQNYFETKEPIGRKWCTILQKVRTANPSATTMLAVAQWQMFVKRLEHKETTCWKHLSNVWQKQLSILPKKQPKDNKISKSFWRCKILTWLLEKHITMPPVGEITLERMTDTRKPSKTLKPLKSKLPARPYKHYFQYIVQYVMDRIV